MTEAISKATQPLSELRTILAEVQATGSSARIHAALLEVVDGLLTHVEKQARAIEALHSDLSHKQGIVTRIHGGDYEGPAPVLASEKADELDL